VNLEVANRRVRIKTWEEMEKEFAVDKDGDIKTNLGYFVSGMEKEMPAHENDD
jgi:hypothetical protein